MTDRPEINDLIERCRKGDPEALGHLVEIYGSRCYGFFYRLTSNRDTSEELLSDLYLRLVEKIDLYDGGSFEKWLFTIASNLFRDRLRKQYRQKRLLEEKIKIQEAQERPQKEMDGEISERLDKGLQNLDKDTAELIMLRFYGDLSFKELAELRGEPIGTTLSKVHRGLKRLKEGMEDPNERNKTTTE